MSNRIIFCVIIFLLRPTQSISQNLEKPWESDLSFIYGARVFLPFLSDSSAAQTVGLMPSLGFNLYFPNKNWGLEIKRDLWFQLIGGNPNSFDLKNYYEVNNLEFFYDGFKKIPLRFGLAHSWTRVDNFEKTLTEQYHKVYHYKGISLDVSYFFWKTRADFRTIIYYNQPKVIHGSSFSLGLTFYFNPLKRK